MKYLEQRVEELEKEVSIIKTKLEESKPQDYMYNYSNMTLLSESDCETSFGIPLDISVIKNPIDTITESINSLADNLITDSNNFPTYPNIIGSWDDSDLDHISNDWVSFKQMDDIPPYEGHENVVSEYFCASEKKIEKDFGKIISKFKILNHEWEMDGYGYIIQTKEGKKIVTTDHGKPIIVDKDFLEIRIKEYKEVIQETERALFLIK